MSELAHVLDKWYKRVWEQEDASAIDEMFVQDPEIKPIGMQKPFDLEEFKELHKLICVQLKEIDIRIDKTVEEGDWLSALCSCYAKNAHTQEPVTVTGTVMVKITDGKLRGGFQHWDFMGPAWATAGRNFRQMSSRAEDSIGVLSNSFQAAISAL